jgi:hypothetical protein
MASDYVMADELRISRDLEGSGYGLIEILSRNLLGGTEEEP